MRHRTIRKIRGRHVASLITALVLLSALPGLGHTQEQGGGEDAALEEMSPQEMRERLEALELEVFKLQAAAEDQNFEEEGIRIKAFRGGQRSLQALNPEISVVGDFFGRYIYSADGRDSIGGERSGAFLRMLGLHLQSNLDPFAFTKMTVGLTPKGAAVGEAYITWTSVAPGLSLTVGQFRQQLGVVNRWHKPGLDQFDFPLMLTVPFGPGGLAQAGVAAHLVLPPVWSHGMELEIQVTNGSNGGVFAGDFFSVPASLARLTHYWDLSPSTYIELGVTGIFGANHLRNVPSDAGVTSEPWRHTIIGGADLTLNWEPLNRSKYHYFTWRSEYLYILKQLDGDKTLRWMGAYSSLEFKVNRSWVIGTRGDLVQPFATDNASQWNWQVVPYVSWWQSPWVRMRLEYDLYLPDMGGMDHRVFLQFTFAAGPHKHERY